MIKKIEVCIILVLMTVFLINGTAYAKTNSVTNDKFLILKGKQTVYPLDKSIGMSDLIAMVEITNGSTEVKAPWLSTVFNCKVLKVYKGDIELGSGKSINIIQRGTKEISFNGYPVFENKQQVLLFLTKVPGYENTYRILGDETNSFLLTKAGDTEYLTKLCGTENLLQGITIYYGDIIDKATKNIKLLADNQKDYNNKKYKLQVYEKTALENRLQELIQEKSSSFITKYDVKEVDNNLVKASDNFGFNIFNKELNGTYGNGKNILISPLSLFTALTVATNGTAGETKEQMSSVLGIEGISNEKLNDGMNDMMNILNLQKYGGNPGFIKLYNSLWINKSFQIKDSFEKIAKDYYNSDVFTEDFASPAAVKDMNNWIDEKTSGLIKNPISEVDPNTRLDIFNVLHFVGKWIAPFDKSMTKKEDFTSTSGKAISVDMMNGKRFMSYYEDEDTKVGLFPYYNASMMVLLPKGDIDKFATKLNYDMINKYNSNLKNFETNVKMPKLSFEYKNTMNDSLENLGMKLPFDINKADFSNMKSGNDSLYIGKALHDCVIKLDEEGTEAAALTSLQLTGSALPPKEIKELYMNKPYIFIIQDNNNLVLFVGKVENPLEK